MTTPNPLPAELEWGTLDYLRKELSPLLSDYGLQNVLNELAKLCHEAALRAALEFDDYKSQVEYDHHGDCLTGLAYLLFK